VDANRLEIGVRLPALVGEPGEYLADAAAFEAAGADAIWLTEGLFRAPATGLDARPVSHDPWARLAAIAAVTHRARIGTAVSVVAMWPPALLASMVTTIDHLARGRLVLGVGAGWEAVQFEAAGLGFDDRGRRLDEFLRALRHLWSEPERPFDGQYYRLPPLRMAEPTRPGGPPIVVGAFSEPGYRRAARLGDGFIHGGGRPEEVEEVSQRLRELRAAAGREDEAFQLWAQVPSPQDRAEWRATLDAHAQAGATGVIVSASSRLLDMLRNPDEEGDRSDLYLAQG
jgi:probable F420-dependent oxidoreductase